MLVTQGKLLCSSTQGPSAVQQAHDRAYFDYVGSDEELLLPSSLQLVLIGDSISSYGEPIPACIQRLEQSTPL